MNLRINNFIIQSFCLTFLSGCIKPQEAADNLISLDNLHFQNSVQIKNDELDTVITFSTEPGFVVKQGLLGVVWEWSAPIEWSVLNVSA